MDNEKEPTKEENALGSFYMGRMRPPPEPKRFLPPGVLTVIALALLGGIVWYAYPRGAEKYTNLDVPLVKADTAPIKSTPTDPGGMEVRHQDSTAFDPLTKNNGGEVEKLLPTGEQPMDKDQVIKAQETSTPTIPAATPPKLDMQVKETGNGTEEIVPKAAEVAPAPVAIPPGGTPPAAPKEDTASVTPAPSPAAPPVEEKLYLPSPNAAPSPAAVAASVKQSEEEDTPVEKPAAKAIEKPAAASASSEGSYEVQLGSYREQADAKRDWGRLQKKYAAQLSTLKMRLVKANIPGKGVYYRMQAGVISKDKAHAICDALKATHGTGCILAKQ